MRPLSSFDPTYRFATSWLLPPGFLFFIRTIIPIYTFGTLFFHFGWTSTHPELGADPVGRSFSYFTYLTFWGLSFYFVFAALHTGSYWLRGTPFLTRWPRFLQEMHSVFYTTIVTLPFLVTIVYWGVLFKRFDTLFNSWSNISMHAFNSVCALFELVFARTSPLPWWHDIPIILILGGYLGVAYITHATQGWWTYSFLDDHNGTTRGKVAAYCVGIAVAGLVIHFLVHWLIWLRVWITEKKGHMRGKASIRDETHLGGATATTEYEMVGGVYDPKRQHSPVVV